MPEYCSPNIQYFLNENQILDLENNNIMILLHTVISGQKDGLFKSCENNGGLVILS